MVTLHNHPSSLPARYSSAILHAPACSHSPCLPGPASTSCAPLPIRSSASRAALLICRTDSCACWPPWLLLGGPRGQGRAPQRLVCAGSHQGLPHTRHTPRLHASARQGQRHRQPQHNSFEWKRAGGVCLAQAQHVLASLGSAQRLRVSTALRKQRSSS